MGYGGPNQGFELMALDRHRSTEVSELRGGQWKEASTEAH